MSEQAPQWEVFPATMIKPTFVLVDRTSGNVAEAEPNYLFGVEEILKHLNSLQTALTAANERAFDLQMRLDYIAQGGIEAELALLRPRAALLTDVIDWIDDEENDSSHGPILTRRGTELRARYDALPAAPVQADVAPYEPKTLEHELAWLLTTAERLEGASIRMRASVQIIRALEPAAGSQP